MNDYNAKLNDRIRHAYLTQAAFAEAVGSHRQIVSMVINGRYNLTPEEQTAWAAKLGHTRDELFPPLVGCEARP